MVNAAVANLNSSSPPDTNLNAQQTFDPVPFYIVDNLPVKSFDATVNCTLDNAEILSDEQFVKL